MLLNFVKPALPALTSRYKSFVEKFKCLAASNFENEFERMQAEILDNLDSEDEAQCFEKYTLKSPTVLERLCSSVPAKVARSFTRPVCVVSVELKWLFSVSTEPRNLLAS